MFNRTRRLFPPPEPNSDSVPCSVFDIQSNTECQRFFDQRTRAAAFSGIFRLLPAVSLLLILAARLGAQNGCSCTNCPQVLADNFEGDFFIQVQNAANPVLGQNGQGVCGVVLHFDHEFVGDLLITLTSPAGQTITLAGPTGFFGETDGTNWDVTFVPCNTPAKPDPGFASTWDNDQNWGIFGNYTGSYYPNAGCLEDFNTGPVNGQWTLTVLDALPNDVGNFYNYQIIFCDQTDIECYSCEANAGNLLQSDTSYCAGDTALLLDLKPTYPGQQMPPPAGAYSYTYIIGVGGVITGYEPGPDLSAYPPGMYTVCGLSYFTNDKNKIPLPDSILTITELTAQLNSSSPPFCGKITSNCLNVNILPLPENITDTATICAPDCFNYYDSSFCSSGVYTVPLQENGCTYTATLYLTVLQPVIEDIYESICPGTCAQTPGFGQYCVAGEYSAVFPGANGCDSIITLHLSVLDAIASIPTPQTLSCSQTSVPLSGAGSSAPGPGVTYQWTAGNGGMLSGATNLIDAVATAAGTYYLQVCKTGDGLTCCDTAFTTVVANQNLPAVPAAITGPGLVCAGQTVEFQADTALFANIYTWTTPPGTTLNAGQGTTIVNLSWTTNTNGNICVTAENACGSSAPVCLPVEVMFVPPAPVVSGPDTLCAGSKSGYSVVSEPGVTGYLWEITGGIIQGNPDSAVIEVIWNTSSGSGTLCARARNGCGPGPATCRDITLIAAPEVQAGVDSAVCGNSVHLYATPDLPDSSGYWIVISGPGQALFSDSVDVSALVKVTQTGSYIFSRVHSNGVCTVSDSVGITFHPLPVIGPPLYACDALNENYTATIPFSGGRAPYQVNGIPVSDNFYISGFLPSGTTYTLILVDTFGCSATMADSFACACSTFAGIMSDQLLQACEGQTVVAQHLGGQILDGNDTAFFLLHTYSGDSLGQVLAQNTTGEFGFQPGMNYESVYYISYVAGNSSNGNLDLADACLSVAPGQPVVFYANPVADAGADTVLCGLSLLLNANTGNGQWTFASSSPSSVLDFSDFNNAQTTITAAQPGAYLLKWEITENGCSDIDEMYIQFNDIPVITDTLQVCGINNENYTIQFNLSGGTPPYTVNGAVMAGYFFESTPIISGNAYTFIVSDSNKCILPEITGAYTCDCVTDAGTMSSQTLAVCATDTFKAVSNGDYKLDGNDVVEYVLHTAAGPALGQILARNKSGLFTFVAGMQYDEIYYVSLVAGNADNGFPDPGDPCYVVSAGQPVKFLRPPVPDAGTDRAVCGLEVELNATGGIFPGIWTLQTGAGTVDFSTPDSTLTSVTVAGAGIYTFRRTELNGQCAGADDVTVTFQDRPTVENLKEHCNGTNTGFTVTFDLTGGTPPFKVDGLNGLFTGPVFLSLALSNNVSYTFTVTDANGCAASPVSGSKYCVCTTDAGSMSVTPAFFCPDQPAVANWNGAAVTDADDLVRFVLHDQPGASLGVVLAVNDQPVFPFAANLQTGVTYYISAIAGNDIGGNVDMTDPCLSVVPGAPVQWKPAPLATLTGDTTICAGQNVSLGFAGVGIFPLSIVYQDGNGANFSLSLPDQQLQQVVIAPLTNTTYTLLQVTDGSLPACTTYYNAPITVWVNEPAQAGVTPADVEICENDPQLISLTALLQGALQGGEWTEISEPASGPGAFDAVKGVFNTQQQTPGIYRFQYRVKGQPPCADDSVTATILIRPAPLAAAGPDVLLDCEQPEQWLGDPATSEGPGMVYQWLLNGVLISDARQLVADTAGVFTLRVNNPFGCFDIDEAQVSFAAPPLVVHGVKVTPVRCFGEINGSIVLDSVSGGVLPFRYALGNDAFGASRVFSNLGPGDYFVRVQDAAGCEWTSAPLTITSPPEIKIDLGDQAEAALGDSVYLILETSLPVSDLDTIIWAPLLDSTAAGKPFQVFAPGYSGKIRVTVIDSNGCFQEDEVIWLVNRERRVYFPNIFMPGSGQNDIFFISAGNDVEEVEIFQIFDRWGGRFFESRHFHPNKPANGWAGEYRGADAPAGVYTFYAVIRFKDGEKEVFAGDITLLR